MFCRDYSACLDVAVARHWPSFTCTYCRDFSPIILDAAAWEEDAARCDAFWLLVDFDLPWLRTSLVVDAFLAGGDDFRTYSDMG